jgi:hypothetical protein
MIRLNGKRLIQKSKCIIILKIIAVNADLQSLQNRIRLKPFKIHLVLLIQKGKWHLLLSHAHQERHLKMSKGSRLILFACVLFVVHTSFINDDINYTDSLNKKFKIISIDSTTFDYYNWIILKNDTSKYSVLSEKISVEKNCNVTKLKVGKTYSLSLSVLSTIKVDSNLNLRISSKAYVIGDKQVKSEKENFYICSCIKGLYYIKDCK